MLLKAQLQTYLSELPKKHKVAMLAFASFCAVLLILPSEQVVASKHSEVSLLEAGVRYQLELPELADSVMNFSDLDSQNWASYKVKNGDTLAKIFNRAGLTARDTYEVSRAGELAKMLISLMPGDTISIKLHETHGFGGLRYQFSPTETLYITPSFETVSGQIDRNLSSHVESKNVDIRYNFAQGEINSSFWNAGVEAGMSSNHIMRLAGIFGWDIDFASEIRQGDTFNIVYEEKYVDGEFVGNGDIVAAEFVNQNEAFSAIKYTDGNFYTAEGRSMRKSFLRAPINFTHVSSNFNPRRFHPVQKRIKPHRGTDYVARIGTPVMSAGDGKVIRAGYDRFNGHHVFIQHGEKYTTKYLHFKKTAVKKGQIVKQGETIGYLGRSGMVTGAHLHYEFLVNGVHRNPRTVELPKADPIDPKEKQAFTEIAALRIQQLSNNKRIMLAMN